jgi:hypothetical protein
METALDILQTLAVMHPMCVLGLMYADITL